MARPLRWGTAPSIAQQVIFVMPQTVRKGCQLLSFPQGPTPCRTERFKNVSPRPSRADSRPSRSATEREGSTRRTRSPWWSDLGAAAARTTCWIICVPHAVEHSDRWMSVPSGYGFKIRTTRRHQGRDRTTRATAGSTDRSAAEKVAVNGTVVASAFPTLATDMRWCFADRRQLS